MMIMLLIMNVQSVVFNLINKKYIWKLSDINKVKKNGFKVFSCFSCGGGSTMGYKLAGYEVLGNCEIDPKMNALYKINNKPKYSFEMGVQDFYKLKTIHEELYDIDILDGSPPCSSFSIAGDREKTWGKKKHFREGQAKQILDDLFFEFLNVAEKLNPKIIIAENVKGIIAGNAKGYMNLIIKHLNKLNYEVQIFLLNSASMGVPQKRERVFIIGKRKDLNLPKLKLNFNEKPILYKEFVDSYYKPFTKNTLTYNRWIKRIYKDNSLGDTVARTEKGKISGFNNYYFKLNRIPNTVVAGGQMMRYDKPGYLSDKDIITIQTFPQDYNFLNANVQYVCGMSVPPLMMKKISEQIYLQLLKGRCL